MDIIITTASGSRYLVADTAIYRMSDHPIDGLGQLPMGRTLMTWTRPVVGMPWRFTTVDGPIITSPITDLSVAPFLAA